MAKTCKQMVIELVSDRVNVSKVFLEHASRLLLEKILSLRVETCY